VGVDGRWRAYEVPSLLILPPRLLHLHRHHHRNTTTITTITILLPLPLPLHLISSFEARPMLMHCDITQHR